MIGTIVRRLLGFGAAWDRAALRIDLSDRTDAFGFRYGWCHLGKHRTHRLDVLPPATMFDGDQVLEEPHPTRWRVFVDGEPAALLSEIGELRGTLQRVLAGHHYPD